MRTILLMIALLLPTLACSEDPQGSDQGALADQAAEGLVVEQGQPPLKDQAQPPLKDKAQPPNKDTGQPPIKDQAQPPIKDKGQPPIKDKGQPPIKDQAPPPPKILTATNPVIPGNHADPHVMRIISPKDKKPIYYLVHTVHNSGDIPLYSSRDLVKWKLEPKKLFGRSSAPGNSIKINNAHFCSIWAPQLVQINSGFLLSFSAQRYKNAKSPCAAYGEDGGVYSAWSASPTGPFAPASHSWEPIPAGANVAKCPAGTRNAIPRSVDWASKNCQGTYCHQIIRLDSDVFLDPLTKRWWLAYSWYTNYPVKVAWEKTNQGEHVHLVELDKADPFAVKCDKKVPQIFAANSQDKSTLTKLAKYCTGCDKMLSFTKGRKGEEMKRGGFSWGVVEGANLFRRGKYVYLLLSGSAWDSAYYHVYWVAATSVEKLVNTDTSRLQGRYLIPSDGMSFGHGTAVLGPDNKSWYFVHHRLNHKPCKDKGQCSRDVWVSPVEFVDKKDGKGAVQIKARWPAKTPGFKVVVP